MIASATIAVAGVVIGIAAAASPKLALAGALGIVFIVFTAFRERRHVWWLANAFIGGAAFAALIGILGVYATNTTVNNGRLSGGFDDPNELAAVLIPALVLCGFAFVASRRRPSR